MWGWIVCTKEWIDEYVYEWVGLDCSNGYNMVRINEWVNTLNEWMKSLNDRDE